MIHEFSQRVRVLFFPKTWANSVSRWILGVFSPSGTVKVTNTANPGDNGSLALDVNIDLVSELIARRLANGPVTREEIERMRQHLFGLVDGSTIIVRGGKATINLDAVVEKVKSEIGDSGDDQGAVAPESTTTINSGFRNGVVNRTPITSTAPVATFGAPGGEGVVVNLACRAVNDGMWASVYFRPFTITSDGRIYAIGGEQAPAIAVVGS